MQWKYWLKQFASLALHLDNLAKMIDRDSETAPATTAG